MSEWRACGLCMGDGIAFYVPGGYMPCQSCGATGQSYECSTCKGRRVVLGQAPSWRFLGWSGQMVQACVPCPECRGTCAPQPTNPFGAVLRH